MQTHTLTYLLPSGGTTEVKRGTARQIAAEIRRLAGDPDGPTFDQVLAALSRGYSVAVGPYEARKVAR